MGLNIVFPCPWMGVDLLTPRSKTGKTWPRGRSFQGVCTRASNLQSFKS